MIVNKIEIMEIAKFIIGTLQENIIGLMILAFIFRLVEKWIDYRAA